MYVTISKRFKTFDKQEKSNSSVQLFHKVYYHQRFIITRNITFKNKIITFLKPNEFDQFYNKKNQQHTSKKYLSRNLQNQRCHRPPKRVKNLHTPTYTNFWKIHFQIRDQRSATGLNFRGSTNTLRYFVHENQTSNKSR